MAVDKAIKSASMPTSLSTCQRSPGDPVRAAATTASTISFPTQAIAAGRAAWPRSSAIIPAANARDDSRTRAKVRGRYRR